ncbi:MAG TPA: DUF2071 domain-containing protein [Gemmatimonadaceae bacterium]|nr:DUF2071 domain-containing protein [Gemmatimonadaceae bacterium]
MTGDIERRIAHRQWPLPRSPWIMFQSWQRLLFAHWPVPIEMLRPLVPASLAIEEFDGTAWVSITPFRLTGLRARFLPPLPFISEFPEMNFRTYVRAGRKPGIFFFSLDAGSRLAVIGARATYRLPYYHADMDIGSDGEWVRYSSRRRSGTNAEFIGRYRAAGAAFQPRPDTIEHFLTERYALYTVLPGGFLARGEIHHGPWDLQPAEARIEVNTVPQAHGITLPDRPPLLQYSARQDTLIWAPSVV